MESDEALFCKAKFQHTFTTSTIIMAVKRLWFTRSMGGAAKCLAPCMGVLSLILRGTVEQIRRLSGDCG